MKRKRKYDRGANPCGNCNSGQHKNCRPKLDGTLCSCSCEWAVNMRDEFKLHLELATERKEKPPSIEEVAQAYRPKYEKVF